VKRRISRRSRPAKLGEDRKSRRRRILRTTKLIGRNDAGEIGAERKMQ
jgi:hypothetical protein